MTPTTSRRYCLTAVRSLRMTYAGTVFRLTSARGFLAAVRLLHERNPDLARRLHVRFIGRIVETEADAFDGMERYGVERIGLLPKDRVMPELAASHMTVVLLAHTREPSASTRGRSSS